MQKVARMATQAQLNRRMRRLFREGDRLLDEAVDLSERAILNSYRDLLKEVQNEVSEIYRKFGDNVDMAEMQKFGRFTALEKNIAVLLSGTRGGVRRTLTTAITNTFKNTFYFSGYAMETPLGWKLGFSALDLDAIKAAIENPLDRIKWPNRLRNRVTELNERIRQAMVESLVQGHGFSATANVLKDKIDRTMADTLRILRTETPRARSESRIKAFNQAARAGQRQGFEPRHVWDATLDSRTRSSHRGIDGKAADANGEWRFGDGTVTRGPGLSGVPRHDIHERCTTRLEVAGFEPEFRRDNVAKREIRFVTYEKWAKSKKIPFEGQEFD